MDEITDELKWCQMAHDEATANGWQGAGIVLAIIDAMADPGDEAGRYLLQWVLRERDRRLARGRDG